MPAALLLLVAGLWLTRRAPRTDRVRAGLLLWGGWTVVTAAVFSFMAGTFHAYYTVALVPGIAALVAIGGREAWRARDGWTGRIALAAASAVTSVWAWVLLGRSATFLPGLRWTVLAVGVVAAVAFLVPVGRRRWLAAVVSAAVLAGVAGPAAYAVQTTVTPHQGSIPLAGPSTGGDAGPGMGDVRAGSDGDGPGGPGNEQTGGALADLLTSANTRWAAATVGSQGAASMMLSTGTAVMAIGGFSGGDPSPTLAQFQEYVANGDVHYFVSGGGMGGGPRGDRNNEITTWAQEHYTALTVDGRTVYDLTAPASS